MKFPDFDNFDIDSFGSEEFENGVAFKFGMKPKKNLIVTKTFPAKPEWLAKFEELKEIAHELSQKMKRASSMRNALWSEIELSLESYDNLRFNEESKEIEQMREQGKGDDKGLIKSPIQFG